jgi:hypothetical protein
MGTNDEAGFSGFLWVERAPIGWSVDRALCDGVITEYRIPRYDRAAGGRLLRRRLALGLGLREAAKRIGITAARLSELEQGSVEAHGEGAMGVMLRRLEGAT